MTGINRLATPTNSNLVVAMKFLSPMMLYRKFLYCKFSSNRFFRDIKSAVFELGSYIYNKPFRWDFTISP